MVGKPRRMLLTTPIKRYLLHCVARAGAEPELLMGELELCAKFGVSRVTVRRAIDELLRADYVIRLPKRRGAFSNPEMAMAVPRCVGIVSGHEAIYSCLTGLVVSGFLRGLSDVLCDFSFVSLDIRNAGDADLEIENMGLDALFWVTPDEAWLGAIDRLLSRQYPLVAVASPYSASYRPPRSNYITFDFASVGVDRAEHFLKLGRRNIVYCGERGQTFEAFARTLGEAGVAFDQACLLETVAEVKARLPELLASGGVDGLVSDGAYNRLRAVLDIVNDYPGADRVALLADRMPSWQDFMGKYPGLDVVAGKVRPYQKVGELAADWLLKLMAGKCGSFEPAVFKPTCATKK